MGEPTGATYRIANVIDFLGVPADRRAACFADLAKWCEIGDACAPEFQRLGLRMVDTFNWTDDGMPGYCNRVEIKTPDGKPIVTITADGIQWADVPAAPPSSEPGTAQ